MKNIILEVEKKYMKKNIISFRTGDIIEIKIWIFEGTKKRIQIFEGIVIAIRKKTLNSSFTVRKIVNNDGIERVFFFHSPNIESISIKRYGYVKKSKLYFLRKLFGKSARIKEKIFFK